MSARTVHAAGDRDALGLDLRRRLSRELHDHIAHLVAAGLNSLDLSEHYARNGDGDRARAKLAGTRQALERALQMTRDLADWLRRPDATLSCLREAAEPTPPGVPAEAEQVFLIVREAVRNALAHSAAEHITIRLSASENDLFTSVEDDGVGIARRHTLSPMSAGLASMRERAAALGGLVDVARDPDGGTRVTVAVPLNREP